jgi:nitroimidazol reductase NimA-like FMN-containing flavoprotein (pyridoxamine 5'-phosphate oxidase superfamily)
MNRRGEIAMTADEQAVFLARSRTIMLSTIDGRGYPHCVAMWFALIDGVVHMTSFRKAQKVVNIRRNPKVSLLAESGSEYAELRGLMIRGQGELVEDVELCNEILGRIQVKHGSAGDASAPDLLRRQAAKRVAIRIHAERVASWDHSKLRGAY